MSLLTRDQRLESIAEAIRDVPDFPKPGILFKDITPLLKNSDRFTDTISLMAESLADHEIDAIAAIEARGFIIGATLAHRLGVGFIPVRKQGKLPYRTVGQSYSLEYGKATIEIHEDATSPGERVVLVDDLLATGGTAAAALHLLRQRGAKIDCSLFLIELDFLAGRERLDGCEIISLLHVDGG